MQGLIARLSATPGRLRWAGRALDADGAAIRAELEQPQPPNRPDRAAGSPGQPPGHRNVAAVLSLSPGMTLDVGPSPCLRPRRPCRPRRRPCPCRPRRCACLDLRPSSRRRRVAGLVLALVDQVGRLVLDVARDVLGLVPDVARRRPCSCRTDSPASSFAFSASSLALSAKLMLTPWVRAPVLGEGSSLSRTARGPSRRRFRRPAARVPPQAARFGFQSEGLQNRVDPPRRRS